MRRVFGLKPLSANDKKNMEEGKETGIDKTTRLFYVACSRAKESLAIVCYSDSPKELKRNVVNYNWFTEDEVKVIDQ